MLILNGSLKAFFEDGYIVDEEKQKDIATLISDRNCLAEIIFLLENRHIHGKLLRLICKVGKDNIEIKWNELPTGARPIRVRLRSNSINHKITGTLESVEFGYEYINNVGKRIIKTKIYNQNQEIK